MKKATLLLAKPRAKWKILSPIIRFVEKVPFSHCAILYGDLVYEAVWPKVRRISYADWLKEYDVVEYRWVEIDPVPMIAALGKEYSILQLFWNLFHIASRLNGRGKMICTEYAALALKKYPKNPDSFGLKDLLSIL